MILSSQDNVCSQPVHPPRKPDPTRTTFLLLLEADEVVDASLLDSMAKRMDLGCDEDQLWISLTVERALLQQTSSVLNRLGTDLDRQRSTISSELGS